MMRVTISHCVGRAMSGRQRLTVVIMSVMGVWCQKIFDLLYIPQVYLDEKKNPNVENPR